MQSAFSTSNGNSGQRTPVYTSPCEMKPKMELGLLREISKESQEDIKDVLLVYLLAEREPDSWADEGIKNIWQGLVAVSLLIRPLS